MDNRIVKVNGEGAKRLAAVLNLFEWKNVDGFHIENNKFILFWVEHPKATKLPAPMGMEFVAPMVDAWLQNIAEYPPEPDIDGSVSKGWLVYCDKWGHIEPYGYQAFAAIEPQWMLHGK